jgi:exodeoxyribonuclease VII large subunit
LKVKVFTVSQITGYIKNLFVNDVFLNGVLVSGEISNFKRNSSGHLYFTLKDERAAINCVMFRGAASGLEFDPVDGDAVVAVGNVSVYEKTGAYQFYAEFVRPAGKGYLYDRFERLKQKLEKEGLFDPARKKPIPETPRVIGVITSRTGAAVRDIITVARRRNKSAEIAVAPAAVQGENAPGEIISALKTLNDWGKADVIILGRGGGAAEDLSAFNNEDLARAIFNSHIPVISAVGHETDFTIADFVADLRAPTPSAAAEIVAPDLLSRLKNLISELHNSMYNLIGQKKYLLSAKVDLLHSLSPLSALERGFAIITKEGRCVNSVAGVLKNDVLDIRLKDGAIKAVVVGLEVGGERF